MVTFTEREERRWAYAQRDRLAGRVLAWLVVLAVLLAMVESARADDVVSWTVTSVGAQHCGVNNLVGTSPALSAAAEMSAAGALCLQGLAYYGVQDMAASTVDAQAFADGAYTGAGTLTLTGQEPATMSVFLAGSCGSTSCQGPISAWSSAPMMLQALFVAIAVVLFFNGLRAGRTA